MNKVKSANGRPDIFEADYVIVGAGSAGCVLANRLSADPNVSVILLEAGGTNSPIKDFRSFGSKLALHVPAGFARAMVDPRVSWPYVTEPDATTAERAHFWPRGRVLGGSSSINGMLYVRGQRQDYDTWQQLGCDGWGWDEVAPYFDILEGTAFSDDRSMHHTGSLKITSPAHVHPVSAAVIQACIEAGIPANPNYNGASQEGVGPFQLAIANGRRVSAATGYLAPIARRQNLRIITDAVASRILVKDGRANSIEIRRGGEPIIISANRELIISAGAINTPQLLLLSGIGPQDELRAMGIAVHHDSPDVGKNLQDHFTLYNEFRLKDGVPSINEAANHPIREAFRYMMSRRGLLSSAAAEVAIFLRSDPDLERPDIQFHGLPGTLARKPDGSAAGLHLDKHPGLTLTGCQLRPESRGTISLRSAEPTALPKIAANYLSDERDQAIAVKICAWARLIAAQPSLIGLIETDSFPGPHVASPDEVLDWARRSGGSVYHPAGTCRMGSDEKSVVDPQLRVRGVRDLRIIDASVMPRLVSGNTNGATTMIAERAIEFFAR